jgi:hypothetical protein
MDSSSGEGELFIIHVRSTHFRFRLPVIIKPHARASPKPSICAGRALEGLDVSPHDVAAEKVEIQIVVVVA